MTATATAGSREGWRRRKRVGFERLRWFARRKREHHFTFHSLRLRRLSSWSPCSRWCVCVVCVRSSVRACVCVRLSVCAFSNRAQSWFSLFLSLPSSSQSQSPFALNLLNRRNHTRTKVFNFFSFLFCFSVSIHQERIARRNKKKRTTTTTKENHVSNDVERGGVRWSSSSPLKEEEEEEEEE